jgi:hypothetical protein
MEASVDETRAMEELVPIESAGVAVSVSLSSGIAIARISH